jgi:hypothetical protein
MAFGIPAQMLVFAIITRVLFVGINWYTLRVLPPNWSDMGIVIGGWAIWDTGYYTRIAIEGYHTADPGISAFFPLFPLLIRTGVEVFRLDLSHQDASIAAVAIANACFFLVVPLFAALVQQLCNESVARTATMFLCVSPYSFFFNAGYTESLFLLLVVLTFRFGNDKKWIRGAMWAALAGATRSTGLALLPALLFMAWRSGAGRRDLIVVSIVPALGLAAFSLHLWLRLGDPLAFVTAQEQWSGFEFRVRFFSQRIFADPSVLIYGGPDYHDLYVPVVFLNVVLWGLGLISLYWVIKWIGGGIAVFTSIIVVSHGLFSWISLGRYLLPAIGVYLVLAIMLEQSSWREVIKPMFYVCSACLLVMLLIMFGHGYWVI